MTAPPADDARSLNWRFVVPEEPSVAAVFDAPEGTDPDDTTGFGVGQRAVVVPDVAAWSRRRPAATTVQAAATSVASGGWLCISFANRWFPSAEPSRRRLTLRRALKALSSAGLDVCQVYLTLPDHRRPAMLVDSANPSQLDYVFRHVFLTYLPGNSFVVRATRRALAFARPLALRVPHSARVMLAPGYCIVARRAS